MPHATARTAPVHCSSASWSPSRRWRCPASRLRLRRDDAATNPYVADAASGRDGLPAGSSLAAAGVALPASVAAAVVVPAGAPLPVGILPPA